MYTLYNDKNPNNRRYYLLFSNYDAIVDLYLCNIFVFVQRYADVLKILVEWWVCADFDSVW